MTAEIDVEETSRNVANFMEHASGYEALSQLALDLAQQAGEVVKRPLSKEQLLRALQVHMEESQILQQAIQERYSVPMKPEQDHSEEPSAAD